RRARRAFTADEIAYQRAARTRRVLAGDAGADVGYRRQPSAGGHLQPAAALDEVAPAVDGGRIGVETRSRRRPRVGFVAVGYQRQREARVDAPGEGNEAHRPAQP